MRRMVMGYYKLAFREKYKVEIDPYFAGQNTAEREENADEA
jgi:hypothetical protein